MSYANLEEFERAVQDYDEAIRLDPELALAYLFRGIAYDELGEYDQAALDYGEATRVDPKLAPAYGNRGIVYFINLGDTEKAIEDFDEAIRLDSEAPNPYAVRAMAFTSLANDVQAREDIEKAVELGWDRESLEDTVNKIKATR